LNNREETVPGLPSPGELLDRLRQSGFTFNHRLGQNFLYDRGTLGAIAREAGVGPGDHVLEIGAGAGTLTVELARLGASVASVEIDRRLLAVLREALAGCSGITLIAGDFLKVDVDQIFADLEQKSGPSAGHRRVVGNLPYYITSPVLMKLVEAAPTARRPWETATVTVQKEVAERLAAPPGGKDYGALTLAVTYYAEVRAGRVIPPGAFRPAPGVASQVVTLVRRPSPPIQADREVLFRLVRAGFGQRRKTLANALSSIGGGRPGLVADWPGLLRGAGIDPKRRAETLSLADFGRLAQAVEPLAGDLWPPIGEAEGPR
jgi:16S rRNA (adenine1518-N6/adenine1519-N6)-dimethyltransferase